MSKFDGAQNHTTHCQQSDVAKLRLFTSTSTASTAGATATSTTSNRLCGRHSGVVHCGEQRRGGGHRGVHRQQYADGQRTGHRGLQCVRGEQLGQQQRCEQSQHRASRCQASHSDAAAAAAVNNVASANRGNSCESCCQAASQQQQQQYTQIAQQTRQQLERITNSQSSGASGAIGDGCASGNSSQIHYRCGQLRWSRTLSSHPKHCLRPQARQQQQRRQQQQQQQLRGVATHAAKRQLFVSSANGSRHQQPTATAATRGEREQRRCSNSSSSSSSNHCSCSTRNTSNSCCCCTVTTQAVASGTLCVRLLQTHIQIAVLLSEARQAASQSVESGQEAGGDATFGCCCVARQCHSRVAVADNSSNTNSSSSSNHNNSNCSSCSGSGSNGQRDGNFNGSRIAAKGGATSGHECAVLSMQNLWQQIS
ncbi:homeobox protein prospero isoform X2 [Drosophila sulfurigaster albostrigata]|uniref:homeobox protein prospero isoform X2 n=1 Tax=Drosophila sulfurigaster albostrigata TaxID=89887 RepID=UPI002D2182D4|nr:homeobox protein prospero isoform X2 [Drosophila sulfurigaster albostrigata]